MIKIDMLFFGYHCLIVSREFVSTAASLLLRANIFVQITSDGRMYIKRRDAMRVQSILNGKMEYSISELRGLYGRLIKTKHKPGMAIGILLSIALCILASSVVWDIRIEGNSTVTDAAIAYELYQCGFYEGQMWSKCDTSEIESRLKLNYQSIAWVNINRRGTVAYITVSEKEGNSDAEAVNPPAYSNIIATCDCVIEEITVRSGIAAVAIGDTVKAGDLLIVGITETNGVEQYCKADGSVVGRISDVISETVSRNDVVRTPISKEVLSVRLEIFKFPVNIFKRYRNSDDKCDIIEEIKVLSVFGNKDLPISVITSYSIEYEENVSFRSDAELVRLAASRLNASTLKRLIGADLVKIRTYGDYTEDGYEMQSHIVYLADVGKDNPYSLETE